MYRRIELIQEPLSLVNPDGEVVHWPAVKAGLMGPGLLEVMEAWADKLAAPKHRIPQNARFYFTEKGWDEIGRYVVAAAQRTGQQYRILAIKEKNLNVIFRDEFQVAGQPVRRKGKRGKGLGK
jgi:hypothetical protein